MNVYDFDKTIYPRDSATDFFWYCVRRYPAALLCLPAALGTALVHLWRPELRGKLKEKIYSFLRFVPDPEAAASAFWDEKMDDIYSWYRERRRDDDLVISASPDFLVGEACRRLGVRFLCTQMDRRTGRLLSPNCRGREKVRRFRAEYAAAPVEEFYSDSWSDRPMMELADRGFLVKKGRVADRLKTAVKGEKVSL
jgi:phosphoserine phosphatase